MEIDYISSDTEVVANIVVDPRATTMGKYCTYHTSLSPPRLGPVEAADMSPSVLSCLTRIETSGTDDVLGASRNTDGPGLPSFDLIGMGGEKDETGLGVMMFFFGSSSQNPADAYAEGRGDSHDQMSGPSPIGKTRSSTTATGETWDRRRASRSPKTEALVLAYAHISRGRLGWAGLGREPSRWNRGAPNRERPEAREEK